MRRALLVLLPSAVLLFTLAALTHAHTGHGTGERPRVANLDGGPQLERVFSRPLCETQDGRLIDAGGAPCARGTLPQHRIELQDVCAGGLRSLPLSSPQDLVVRLRATEVNADPARKEIFFAAVSGLTGARGESRLIRMRQDSGAGCPRAESLFHYPSRTTVGRLPRGAVARATWDTEVRDYTRRFAGKEIRVLETYLSGSDSSCCPSFLRKTYFRLAHERDRYQRFRTEVIGN
jgi:hypothetical protein